MPNNAVHMEALQPDLSSKLHSRKRVPVCSLILNLRTLNFCRQKHDDVLEWIMFLNLHADMLYSIIWGDKDTYRLAFHLAGKSSSFSQVHRAPFPLTGNPRHVD